MNGIMIEEGALLQAKDFSPTRTYALDSLDEAKDKFESRRIDISKNSSLMDIRDSPVPQQRKD